MPIHHHVERDLPELKLWIESLQLGLGLRRSSYQGLEQ